MAQLNNTMDIIKILDKSNCRECNYPTCMAFAAAVVTGQKRLDECPRLGKDVIDEYGGHTKKVNEIEQDMERAVELMKEKIRSIDLSSTANRLGLPFSNSTLTIKVCGKNVYVDSDGRFSSEIHLHQWIMGPIFNYIFYSAGIAPKGEWVSFRELKNGKTWYNFFVQRCEKPLKKVADTYPDLFHDMLYLFSGKQVENHYQSDISLVLYPLEKVPVLICYWRPEDGLDSSLNIYFDSTASDNLQVDYIYVLATGLLTMFEKIALRHGG